MRVVGRLVLLVLVVASLAVPQLRASCVAVAISSIAPTDGGSATPPALITPNSTGAPAILNNAGSSELVSDLLVYDDGGGSNCFQSGQTLVFTYNLQMTSPDPATIGQNIAAYVRDFYLYDSDTFHTGLTITASAAYGFTPQGRIQTLISVKVINSGTAGNLLTGPTGSALRIKNMRFNATPLLSGSNATVTLSSAFGTIGPVPVGIAQQGAGPLTVGPGSLDFGQLAIGSTSLAKDVTFTNGGSVAVVFSNVAMTGPFSHTGCDTGVDPNSTCTMHIFFSPTVVGAAAGTLSITDNALGSPHSVQLSGSGFEPPPVMTSLAPTQLYAGYGSFVLTVNGTGFTPTTVVRWNGAPRTTHFVGLNQVTAVINGPDVAQPGTNSVTVASGGGTSNANTVTVLTGRFPARAKLYIVPDITRGQGYVTKITLVNLTASPNTATVNTINQAGALVRSQDYLLPPAGTVRISTAESERFMSPSVVEWAAIGADADLAVNVFFEYIDQTGLIVNSIGFNDAPPLTDFSFPVEFENSATSIGRTMGVGLANVTGNSNQVTMQLLDRSGAVVATDTRTLAAFGQTSFDMRSVTAFTAAIAAGSVAGNFIGAVAVKADYPVSTIATLDDFGPFSAVPVMLGRSTLRAEDIAATCPAASEIAQINRDFNITFNNDQSGPALACRAIEGSVDLTLAQKQLYQGLRAMRFMAFDVPLPWTTLEFFPKPEKTNPYDWLHGAVQGIAMRGNFYEPSVVSCCPSFGTLGIDLGPQNPLDAGWHPAGPGQTLTGVDQVPFTLTRNGRVVEGGSTSCTPIATLQTNGFAHYLLEWQALHSGTFFDDTRAGEPRGGYRDFYNSLAASIRGEACNGQAAILAAPTQINFLPQGLGTESARVSVAVTGGTTQPISVGGAFIIGSSAFVIKTNGCANGVQVSPSCVLTVAFAPVIAGPQNGILVVNSGAGAVVVPLAGTGVPATPLPSMQRLYIIPDIVTGGGYVTKLTATNLTSVATPFVINYISQAGALLQSRSYSLGAGETQRISTDEAQRFAATDVRWAVVGSEQALGLNLFFEYIDGTGQIVNTIGFNDTPQLTAFTIPVEFEPGTPAAPIGRTIGLVAATASANGSTLTLQLLDSAGTVVDTETLLLPPYGQTSLDLRRIPKLAAALPAGNFVGSLVVHATNPVSAIAVQDDQGPFSALPVVAGAAK